MRLEAVSNLKWTTLSQASRIAAQLLSVLFLARLLPPSDFGLISMALIVTGFTGIFRDCGTAAAVIQKTLDPSPIFLDTIFWLNVLIGVVIAIALALFSPLIAIGFAEPQLKEVLCALVMTFPVISLGVVQQSILERKFHFKQLAIIEFVAAFTGLVAAILAAYVGWGVYSLVLQSLLVAIFGTLGLWYVSDWNPSFRWSRIEIDKLLKFSGNLVGFNVFNYLIRNADNLLIGRFLGASELGYYTMAYRLMLWPLQNISAVVGRALFPIFSRLQSDHRLLVEAYIQTIVGIVFITAPLMVGFFLLREPLIVLTLGDRWLPTANILAWLIPVGLFQSIGGTLGFIYLAVGRTDVMFKWSVGASFLIVPAFALGLNWGASGVAAAYAIASLLLCYPGLAIPFKLIGLKVNRVLFALVPSLTASIFMALVIEVAIFILPVSGVHQLLKLCAIILIGIVGYGVSSLIVQLPNLRQIYRLIST